MTWLILALVAVAGLAVAGFPRMRVPQERQREGPEDPAWSKAMTA